MWGRGGRGVIKRGVMQKREVVSLSEGALLKVDMVSRKWVYLEQFVFFFKQRTAYEVIW